MGERAHNPPESCRFLTPLFIASCVVLLLGAVGLEAGMRRAIQTYAKLPIDLRKPLGLFDARLPTFRPALAEPFYDLELSEAVGTEQALRLCFDDIHGSDAQEFQTLLFVTYYSDPRDTVPHTPEVCYRQAGSTVNDIRIEPLKIPALGEAGRGVTAQILELEERDWHQVLVYLFYSNGRFYDDRLSLRFAMNVPGDRHVYFSKIEVLTSVPPGTDPAEALTRCKRLAGEAIPVLIRDHFPTREAVAGGDGPR